MENRLSGGVARRRGTDGMSKNNPFKEPTGRGALKKTMTFGDEPPKVDDAGNPNVTAAFDPNVIYDIKPNGSWAGWSRNANNSAYMKSFPTGTFIAHNKDGEISFRGMGETRFELGGFTVSASDNVDVASGGMLTVKTVGGLEAQISGDGNITIGGATLINILGDAGIAVKGNATISAGGSASVDAAGISLSSSAGIAIGAAGGISLQAGGGIKMQEGGAKVSGYMGGGNEG